MAFTFLPGEAFAQWTLDKEVVTVRRLNRDTGAVTASATNIHANRMRPGGGDEPTTDGGGVPTTRLTWHVRSDQPALSALAGGVRQGDVILDAAGVQWVIGQVGNPKAGEPYVCETVGVVGS